MKKSEAITIQTRDENWNRFPVFVWAEGQDFVTDVDGKVFRARNQFGLDSKLDDAGIPKPRNLYFVDDPDYESGGKP